MKHITKLLIISFITLGLHHKTFAQVGIGTTSPTEILDLESSSAIQTAIDINCTGAGDAIIHFQLSGTAVYTIGVDNSDGDKFKIGTTAPETGTIVTVDATNTTVELDGNAANSTLTVFNDGNNTNRQGIAVQCGEDNPVGTNIAISFADGDGTAQGDITFTAGTVSYNAFTAGHNASLPEHDNTKGYAYGTLLCIEKIKLANDSLARSLEYDVCPCKEKYASNILGAYSNKRTNQKNLHQVYVLGDGHLLVNNQGGNIKIGDAITSSSVDGIGMRADSSCVIIGYAQENYNFKAGENYLLPVQYGLGYYTNPDKISKLEQKILDLEKAQKQEYAELLLQIQALKKNQEELKPNIILGSK